MTLDQLSIKELNLYNQVLSIEGTMEDKYRIISILGIYDQYKLIHQQYAMISSESVEALKRGLFIQWYALTEPSCFTGIDLLKIEAREEIINSLNHLLEKYLIDEELAWMIGYYKEWDFAFSDFKIHENFFNYCYSITSILNKKEMKNRGQMGIYWNSIESKN